MRIKAIILMPLFVIAGLLFVLSFHTIRTAEATHVIAKEQLNMQDIYVDTRSWTIEDLLKHMNVVEAMMRKGVASEIPQFVRYNAAVSQGSESLSDIVSKIKSIDSKYGVSESSKIAASKVMELLEEQGVHKQLENGLSKMKELGAGIISEVEE
jgi:hypothetical protein